MYIYFKAITVKQNYSLINFFLHNNNNGEHYLNENMHSIKQWNKQTCSNPQKCKQTFEPYYLLILFYTS